MKQPSNLVHVLVFSFLVLGYCPALFAATQASAKSGTIPSHSNLASGKKNPPDPVSALKTAQDNLAKATQALQQEKDALEKTIPNLKQSVQTADEEKLSAEKANQEADKNLKDAQQKQAAATDAENKAKREDKPKAKAASDKATASVTAAEKVLRQAVEKVTTTTAQKAKAEKDLTNAESRKKNIQEALNDSKPPVKNESPSTSTPAELKNAPANLLSLKDIDGLKNAITSLQQQLPTAIAAAIADRYKLVIPALPPNVSTETLVYALLAYFSLNIAISIIILFRQRKPEPPLRQPTGNADSDHAKPADIVEPTPKPKTSITNQASQETDPVGLETPAATVMPPVTQDFPTLEKGAECALVSANIGLFEWKLSEDALHLSAVHRKLLGLPNDADKPITEEDFYNRIINVDRDRVKSAIESCKSGRGKKISYYTWHGQRQQQKLCTHIYYGLNENKQGYLIGFSHIHQGDCQQDLEQIVDSKLGSVIDLRKIHAFQAGNIDYFEADLNNPDYGNIDIKFHHPSSSLLTVSGKRKLESLEAYFNKEGYAEFIKAIECDDCTGEDQFVDLDLIPQNGESEAKPVRIRLFFDIQGGKRLLSGFVQEVVKRDVPIPASHPPLSAMEEQRAVEEREQTSKKLEEIITAQENVLKLMGKLEKMPETMQQVAKDLGLLTSNKGEIPTKNDIYEMINGALKITKGWKDNIDNQLNPIREYLASNIKVKEQNIIDKDNLIQQLTESTRQQAEQYSKKVDDMNNIIHFMEEILNRFTKMPWNYICHMFGLSIKSSHTQDLDNSSESNHGLLKEDPQLNKAWQIAQLTNKIDRLLDPNFQDYPYLLDMQRSMLELQSRINQQYPEWNDDDRFKWGISGLQEKLQILLPNDSRTFQLEKPSADLNATANNELQKAYLRTNFSRYIFPILRANALLQTYPHRSLVDSPIGRAVAAVDVISRDALEHVGLIPEPIGLLEKLPDKYTNDSEAIQRIDTEFLRSQPEYESKIRDRLKAVDMDQYIVVDVYRWGLTDKSTGEVLKSSFNVRKPQAS